MPCAPVGDIELYYETFGEPDDQPVLLVAGLGAQCLSWPEGFCEGLADRALRVIRFDNRDIGLSTKLDHLPFSLADALETIGTGRRLDAPYLLDDMAADAVGLLDVLGIDRAHVVGMSLGGMLAQLIAINHRDRVRTLTSVMSTTGNAEYGTSSPEALEALLRPGATTREGSISRSLEQRRVWGTSEYLDEVDLADYFGRLWDRDHHATASQRQYGAVFAAGDREPALRELDVPTLVIHGDQDPLIDLSGGERTAELIPGAQLLILEGMAHDLPTTYWAPIIESIVQLVVNP